MGTENHAHTQKNTATESKSYGAPSYAREEMLYFAGIKQKRVPELPLLCHIVTPHAQ